MTKNDKQPTNQEILQAINAFAEDVASKDDIKAIRSEMATKDDIKRLEQGQKEIWQRLDNVPYRFELDELETRVEKLETKI